MPKYHINFGLKAFFVHKNMDIDIRIGYDRFFMKADGDIPTINRKVDGFCRCKDWERAFSVGIFAFLRNFGRRV